MTHLLTEPEECDGVLSASKAARAVKIARPAKYSVPNINRSSVQCEIIRI